MRVLAELFTICVGVLALAKYTINFIEKKRGRRKLNNLDHVRQLEDDNKEIDKALENIRGTQKERRKKWPG